MTNQAGCSSNHTCAYTNTYATDPKYLSLYTFPIRFTRNGWRQFTRVNHSLGARYLRAVVMFHELACYITAHEEDGCKLDTICQEVRYDDEVYLLLMKCHGVWLITDVGLMDGNAPANVTTRATDFAYFPIFVWQRITAGLRTVLRQVLCGWCRKATTISTNSAALSPYQNHVNGGYQYVY